MQASAAEFNRITLACRRHSDKLTETRRQLGSYSLRRMRTARIKKTKCIIELLCNVRIRQLLLKRYVASYNVLRKFNCKIKVSEKAVFRRIDST